MKKGLFLLPLLAGFVLAGCEFTIGGKTFQIGGNKDNNTQQNGNGNGTGTGGNTNTGGNDSTGGNTSGGGGGSTVQGQLIATITMTNPSSTGTKVSDDEYTWSKDGCTVKVETYKNTQQNVATAVSSSGSYEMRLYNKFLATLECSQKFSSFVLVSTTFSDSKYVYDEPNFDNATADFDGTMTTTVTLNEPSSSFEIYAYKQIRVASIAFYA